MDAEALVSGEGCGGAGEQQRGQGEGPHRIWSGETLDIFFSCSSASGQLVFRPTSADSCNTFFFGGLDQGSGIFTRTAKTGPVGEIVGVWVQHRQGQVRGNRKAKEGRGGRRFCQGDKGEMDCRLSVLGGVRKMGGKAANRGMRLSLGSEKGARLGPNSWHAICRRMGPSIGRKVVPSFMRTVRYGDLHGGAVSPSSVGHCG